MKLVIDIPEEEYKRVMDGKWYGNGLDGYIENGTPLPKGHGRLIDADALGVQISMIRDKYNYYGDEYEAGCFGSFDRAVDEVIDAQTIIEADTARDCKTCGHSKDGKCAYTEECHDCMWESKYIEADKDGERG